jgi:hypothetical protein
MTSLCHNFHNTYLIRPVLFLGDIIIGMRVCVIMLIQHVIDTF